MTPIIIPATTLNLVVGMSRGTPECPENDLPAVSFNFPPCLAEAIVGEILAPHAKPHHFYVGLNPSGTDFELSLHCIIPLPNLARLPLEEMRADLLVEPQGPPFVYVIGNEADFNTARIGAFLDRKQEIGGFCVACGYEPRGRSVTRMVDGWMMRLNTIYGADIRERMKAALGFTRRS